MAETQDDAPPAWFRRAPRTRQALAVLAVALAGTWAGLFAGARTTTAIGPFETRMNVQLSLKGQTIVNVPPLGSLDMKTHRGPLRVDMEVWRLRPQDVKALLTGPQSLTDLEDRLVDDLRRAVVGMGVRTVVAALAGGLVLGLLAFRTVRRTLLVGAVSVGLVAAGGGVAALTWNPKALLEPRYTGLLVSAPSVVGSAGDIVSRFRSYRGELAKLATNVSRLYDATSTLPVYAPDTTTIRVLSVADIHDNPAAFNVMHSLVQQFSVDLIIDAGDLTDHGSQPENALAGQIATFDIPYVYVRGNHDSADTEAAVARQRNAVVLSGTVATVSGMRLIGSADPRFTPDLSVKVPGEDAVKAMGTQLADSARTAARIDGAPPDIAVVHDPAAAPPLAGAVPLVLAGHTHRRATSLLPGTRMIVQGSTGGAGLRALESTPPTPIECSVLYFDRTTRELQAWDDITLGGLGSTSAMIERHLASSMKLPEPAATPTVSGTETTTVTTTVP
jgi:predicted MPP superfamily phosphohydrolase